MARGANFLGMLLLSLCLAPATWAQPDEEAARQRLDAIGEAIQDLSRRLSTTRQAQDAADKALREVETSLAETHRRLDALQAERQRLDEEVADLQRRRDSLGAERADQVEALNVQLDALYRLGLTPQLKLLLNQDDPARLDRLQHYLNQLARARNERLEEIERLDTALAGNRRELDTRGKRLDALAEELAGRSAELARQREERAELISRLDSRYETEESRMQALDRERMNAEQVLEEVREALARLERPPASTAIEQTRGELPWPVQGAIASQFRRGAGVHHNGILIQAAEGTPVKAVHAGRVVFADWMRGFGNLLIIDHGDHVMTLHAHLQHFETGVGSGISRGDILGVVGSSGGHDRPALYFEVRRAGEPIDPQSWIAAR